jgi:hypothetical protein
MTEGKRPAPGPGIDVASDLLDDPEWRAVEEQRRAERAKKRPVDPVAEALYAADKAKREPKGS